MLEGIKVESTGDCKFENQEADSILFAPMKERDVVIDIESCGDHTMKGGESAVFLTVNVDELAGENRVTSQQPSNAKSVGGGGVGSPETKKEKHKSMSAKKPPKPPRPPRGLSLDAADQRLIKELSELAMIKRARMERIKALKKMKAAKAASTSSASQSGGNLVATVFTILFCIVILFRGCHPPWILQRNSIPSLNGEAGGKIAMELVLSTRTAGVESPNIM